MSTVIYRNRTFSQLPLLAIRIAYRKAIKPSSTSACELYNLSEDLEESTNVALSIRSILAELKRYAQEAHVEPQFGVVIDPSVAFDGHLAD